jgi:hypothetical protein
MAEADPKLALYELYLNTAEKVSDRRAQANAWMLSVNSAIVALYGYLQADKSAVTAGLKSVRLWAIPATGVIVCLAWAALLTSYRKLSRAKFAVIAEIEAKLPVAPFTREHKVYHHDRRRSLPTVETLIPSCFALLYAVMLGATILTRNAQ